MNRLLNFPVTKPKKNNKSKWGHIMLKPITGPSLPNSTAAEEAVVETEHFRCTVLTDRLLRLEFSPEGQFEDRPSQVFWYRKQAAPSFTVERDGSKLSLKTASLHLWCSTGALEKVKKSIGVRVLETNSTWRLGDQDDLNLKGTARTLDRSSGEVDLEDGLISRSGWAAVDDTHSLVFDDQGNLAARKAPADYLDIYFFGHGLDYQAALRDFSLVSGKAPLIPRWALGNWWSRYWEYSADELLQLMDDFKDHQVPLSVCVVDMDWHVTETGNASPGWTGYSWNRKLFPDPEYFLAQLHQKGLKVSLNLHPAAGVFPHEDRYQEMCRALELDPRKGKPIKFDVADPVFREAYFKVLHHPLEDAGVDFWWIDWQQGVASGVEGLDPLWWLNHYHYLDLSERSSRPTLLLSRYGGLGSQRYPVGFSGDAIASWESLAFQPYFTATAANVNYSWWSHDIGGHMKGIRDPELYTRWVQFGVFSPIFRLHSGKEASQERRPWGYDQEVEQITRQYMRLRHRLIPYLYSMVYRAHQQDLPLVLPMYYEWPHEEKTYQYPEQYLFGSELLVAPYLSPRDARSRLSEKEVWLPEGDWFEFFQGRQYRGGTCYQIRGELSDIPVFARAGAIIPLAGEGALADTGTPSSLEIQLFPLADNQFVLAEDDGKGAFSEILIEQSFSQAEWLVCVRPATGDILHLPEKRELLLVFRYIPENVRISADINGSPVNVNRCYIKETLSLRVSGLLLSPQDRLVVQLRPDNGRFS